MNQEQEKKHRKIGLTVALALHVLILGMFFFILAWKEPDPPLPQYGIELNFGLDQTGSGETVQPQPNPVVEEATPEESAETEIEEVTETDPAEPVEEVTPAEVETQPEPSPDVIEEVPESTPEVIEETQQEVDEPKIPEAQPYPGSNTANQGDDASEAGDKGKEEGTIDARAIYGAQGAGQGASLQMEGWNWDYIPRPDDTSTENGKIVFQITIDDQGEVIRVRTLEKTVSPAVERLYQQAVESVTFSRTADNVRPTPTSTGRITFIIKSK
jgi:periplasmic protein TonB